MRPKKVVLCLCGNEILLSRRVFLLRTWGFEVVGVLSVTALMMLAEEMTRVDAVLVDAPFVFRVQDSRRLVKVQPEVVVVCSFLPGKHESAELCADRYVDAGSPAQIVAAIKDGTARKRGPKRREVGLAMRGMVQVIKEGLEVVNV